MLELNPVCYHYTGGYRRDVQLHVASALVYVSPLIQDKIVPVYTIFELILERGPISVCCSWKRHSEERSTEDVVLLGTVLPKHCVWVSWAEQARALDEAERNSSGDDDGDDLRAR